MNANDKFFDFEPEEQTQTPFETTVPPQVTMQRQSLGQSLSFSPPNDNEALQKAQHEFDDVIQTSKGVDNRLTELLTQNQGLIKSIFPGKMQRLIAEKERLMVGSALDFRLNLLKLGNQFRLEAMRDKYDVYLKCYKGENRLLLTQFMMKKLREVQSVVRQEEIGAFRELEEMYAQAQTLVIPSMRESYILQIQDRQNRLMSAIKKLLVRFESIIDENLE